MSVIYTAAVAIKSKADAEALIATGLLSEADVDALSAEYGFQVPKTLTIESTIEWAPSGFAQFGLDRGATHEDAVRVLKDEIEAHGDPMSFASEWDLTLDAKHKVFYGTEVVYVSP